jgi:2-keto-4-pentenoate hydratase
MNIDNAIESIWRRSEEGVHFPKEWEGKLSPSEAYEVQLGLLNRYVAAGDIHVGWKIGLTSKATQSQFSLYEPMFGFLLRSGAKPSGTVFAWSELIRPGFEHELCLTVGKTRQGPGVTLEQARAAISAAAPALEIVELRGDRRRDLGLVLTDNAGQKAFVTGPPTTPSQGTSIWVMS